jgi:DNA topoisomerase I
MKTIEVSMSTLMIVESPSKAKTIGKYLYKDGIKVVASKGHVRDLDDKLGMKAVEIDNGFKMHFVDNDRNRREIDEIKRLAKGCGLVYLATDPDREGEAISWHLKNIIKSVNKSVTFKRVTYHEINEKAIRKAIANASEIEMDKVYAQFARRCIDYVFGLKSSSIAQKAVTTGVSSGRVQSPALRLLTEREREIEAFKPVTYWSIAIASEKNGIRFPARLSRIGSDKIDKQSITDLEYKDKHLSRIQELIDGKERLVVKDIKTSKVSRKPKAPYKLTTVQSDAINKFGWSAKTVTETLQTLFEGNGGEHGYITYPRTDTTTISNEGLEAIRQFGKEHYPEFLSDKPIQYLVKSKTAQEAHECVRPTDITFTPEKAKSVLSGNELKLYTLIWQRTMASQLKPALFDSTRIEFNLSNDYSFRANGSVLLYKGYLEVYQEGKDIDSEEEDNVKLPEIFGNDKLPVVDLKCEEKQTVPPVRYNEASLIKVLEEYGIGRPSTFAKIPETLKKRGYIEINQKRITVTPLGKRVNDFISSHFPDYVDYQYTAHLEDGLDEIVNGKINWVVYTNDFWGNFSNTLKEVSATVKTTPKGEETDETCPQCGKHKLVKLVSRFGEYLRCSDKNCGYKRNLAPVKEKEYLENKSCPKCGGRLVVGSGKFGPYTRCENNHGIDKATKKHRGSCDFFGNKFGDEAKKKPKVVLGRCAVCSKNGKEGDITAIVGKWGKPYLYCSNRQHLHGTDGKKGALTYADASELTGKDIPVIETEVGNLTS